MASASKPVGRAAANESIARHFSRQMLAATSPLGMWTDPPVVGLATAVTTLTALALARYHESPPPSIVLWGLALLPVVVALAISASLLGARGRVVGWLASLPFGITNVNGLLNGVGVNLVVRFADAVPSREELDEALCRVHEECFCLEIFEDELEVEIRIGVLDSKLNPARAAYRRYRRVQRIIDEAIVSLGERYAVQGVRVC